MEAGLAQPLMAMLPTEITRLLLDQLLYKEALPMRRVNRQWRALIDRDFIKPDYNSCEDSKFDDIRKTSRFSRVLSAEYHRVEEALTWPVMAKRCPRIDTLLLSFKKDQTMPYQTILSTLQGFHRLAAIYLEGVRFCQIHELLPLLIESFPQLQHLRLRVLPTNMSEEDHPNHNPAWLQQTRKMQNMPGLRSLDLEWEILSQMNFCDCSDEFCLPLYEAIHRPLVYLIAAAKNLEVLKIKKTGEFEELNSEYSKLFSTLHETHLNLREGVLQQCYLHSIPASAFENLTLIECWAPYEFEEKEGIEDFAADSVWRSKLKHFKQMDGFADYPFCENLETLHIDCRWGVYEFIRKLRSPLYDLKGPLRSLNSLYLCGSEQTDEDGHRHPENLKFTDLDRLVKVFPNIEQLTLLEQKDICIIELGDEHDADYADSYFENEASAEFCLRKEVEMFPSTEGFALATPCSVNEWERRMSSLNHQNAMELDSNRRVEWYNKRRQKFETADPEEYLRANLPRLQQLTIT